MLSKYRTNILHNLALVVIGCVTLFYGLDTIYPKLVSDERSFLLDADMLNGLPYYPYLLLANGLGTTHTLFPYLLSIPLNLLGYSVFSLRFVPALFGVLGIISLYWLIRIITDRKDLAFIGALTLIFSHWYIAVSRVAIEVSETLFFSIINLIFISLFVKKYDQPTYLFKWKLNSNYLYVCLSGLSFGLLQHTYQAARIYALFYFCFFIYFWLKNRINLAEIARQASILLVSSFLVVSPLVYVYIKHSEQLDSRKSELVFSQNLSPSDLFWSLKQSTIRTLGMFHLRGYDVSCYNVPETPMLDIVIGVIFILGLVIGHGFLKQELNIMLLLFFFFSLVPSILSYWPASPHGLRSAGAIIPVFVWSGVFFKTLVDKRKMWAYLLISILLFTVVGINLRKYFIDQAQLKEDCFRYSIESLTDFKRNYLEMSKGVKFIR